MRNHKRSKVYYGICVEDSALSRLGIVHYHLGHSYQNHQSSPRWKTPARVSPCSPHRPKSSSAPAYRQLAQACGQVGGRRRSNNIWCINPCNDLHRIEVITTSPNAHQPTPSYTPRDTAINPKSFQQKLRWLHKHKIVKLHSTSLCNTYITTIRYSYSFAIK